MSYDLKSFPYYRRVIHQMGRIFTGVFKPNVINATGKVFGVKNVFICI